MHMVSEVKEAAAIVNAEYKTEKAYLEKYDGGVPWVCENAKTYASERSFIKFFTTRWSYFDAHEFRNACREGV